MRPAVIAHRGASAARQENTLDAFRHAAELGADWIELDVRLNSAADLVIHHDPTLADGTVIAAMQPADQPEWMPTLGESLDAAQPMKVNIEIKNGPDEPGHDSSNAIVALVAAVARELRPADDLLVTSFNRSTVDLMGEVAPEIPRGLLTYQEAPSAQHLAELAAAGYVAINPWYPFVTQEVIAMAHDAGLLVNTWTVDDPEIMASLTSWGIDGIVTNVPDLGRTIVDGNHPQS